MRKGVLFTLLFLVLVPCVAGISNIDELSKEYYNLGEKIVISGYILETENVWGLFKIDLDCGKKTPLLVKTISLKANEKNEFSEELPIPYSITGDCKIIMSFVVGENTIEQVESSGFTITKDLIGNFEVSETMIQLGDEVEIKGFVSKKDSSKINGVATLYFKKEGVNIFVDVVDVVDGSLTYDFESAAKPSGVYDLEVFVNDVFGNEKLFTDAPQINVVNEIYVLAKPNKENILPGNVISIFGEVKTVLQKVVKTADIVIILDEIPYEGKVNGGEFNQRIKLRENIKSGEHKVHVIVEDKMGNVGETDTNFIVEAVPTDLKIKIVNGPFKPGDKIVAVPGLYDQAGDLISESVGVSLLDNKGNEINSGDVASDGNIEFSIPSFAVPGNWHIAGKASGLETKEDILIGEISMIDFSINNQTLVIKNIGNIKYKGEIDIFITGSSGETSINEKISLKPGREERINLGYEVDKTGVYTVKVGDKEFTEVKVISKSGLFRYDYLYYLIVVLFVGFLVWLFLFKRKPKVRRKKKIEVKNISEIKVEKDKKKEYAEAFKEMALKNIDDTDEKKKGFGLFKRKDKKDAGIIRLGNRELYRKKTEKEKINDALWNRPVKKISKVERKKFVNESKKGEDSGLFNMFG